MKPFHNLSVQTTSTALAALAAVLITSSVQSADLPRKEAAPAPAPVFTPPVFTWTGFYAGVNAGWAGRRERVGFGVVPGLNNPNIGSIRKNGLTGGIQAGYNWQFGSLVYGVEADLQYANLSGSLGPVGLAGGGTATASNKLNWYGTLRPRLGFAINRTLIFVTGGLAWGKTAYRLSSTDGVGNTFTMNSTKTRIGWTVGGGVEHALTDKWSAKLEYGYINLGSSNLNTAVFNAGVATGATATSRARTKFHTLRAGLNYRF